MTFREYENLQVGDKVRLHFSCDPDQIVVKAADDEVTTMVEGESAHAPVFYTNRYEDVDIVRTGEENKYPGDSMINRIHTWLICFYNIYLKSKYTEEEQSKMNLWDRQKLFIEYVKEHWGV